MTPKPTLPKNLLKDIKPSNKVWFEKYKTESDPRKNYYHSNVQEFLEFCAYNNDKEIEDIDGTDVELYIAALEKYTDSPSTINRRLSALSGFRNFLHSKHPDIFSEKFLSPLPYHRKLTNENPTDIKALSLVQLNYAKKYNRRSVKDEYIFELFFQLGISEDDLVARNFPETRNVQVDEIIKKVPKGTVKLGTIHSYFTRVTKHLQDKRVYDKSRRKVNSYDLIRSHEAYFLRCPNCGLAFENINKYWVLAKVKIDEADYQDEYRIVCADCKGANTK